MYKKNKKKQCRKTKSTSFQRLLYPDTPGPKGTRLTGLSIVYALVKAQN